MTHSGTRQNSALALAVASVLAGAAAAAPAHAAATSDGLEEVIVTATRRAENILDVPYNITAVSGAQIEKANVFDSVELLRSIPGVATVDRGQRNSSVVNGIRIRGLNVDSSALGDYAISAVSTVSTYVDDTPVFANLLLKDIDRVAVLRGPQGTLYGSGALGGTVRYVLTEPQLDTTSAKLAGTFSQVNGSDGVGLAGDVTFNVPIGQTFAVRGNLSRADYPGITDYVNLYRLDSSGIPVAPNGVLDPAASYYRKKDATPSTSGTGAWPRSGSRPRASTRRSRTSTRTTTWGDVGSRPRASTVTVVATTNTRTARSSWSRRRARSTWARSRPTSTSASQH